MNADQLLNVVGYAGKLLIESGAEIYRVEETMVRLCKSFHEVEDAESFVTLTGIMLSITVDQKTSTKILRVHSRGVDLHCIDSINTLSRQASITPFTLDELDQKLQEIGKLPRYSILTTLFFAAISAAGFSMFFKGTAMDMLCSFGIGFFIKFITYLMERREINNFFTNAIGAACAAILALLSHAYVPHTEVDNIIISSIMLLVPGLAITNAVRDTVAGDYLSGLARASEAILVAIAIAAGIGMVLHFSMVQGGNF